MRRDVADFAVTWAVTAAAWTLLLVLVAGWSLYERIVALYWPFP